MSHDQYSGSSAKKRGKPPLLFFQGLAVSLAIIAILNFQIDFHVASSRSDKIMVDADLLSHLVLGYKSVVADNLWIRLLQDIDYKDSEKISKGWVFHMLDAITTLDSRYKIAYQVGVVILSVVVRDGIGAAVLYERAVAMYPKDWSFAYRASSHYFHELKQCRRAAELYKIAVENGAPAWVAALSGRLFAKSGQYELARSIIIDALKRNKVERFAIELKKRLQQLDEHYQDPSDTTFTEGLDCQAN